jgi:all-trans-retinol 13,14-reductase
VPGLFLTGQDVVSPGVTGAMMGGVVAAAALDPRLARRLL